MGCHYTYDLTIYENTRKLPLASDENAKAVRYYMKARPLDFDVFDLEDSGDPLAEIVNLCECNGWDDDDALMVQMSKEFPDLVFCVEWRDEGGANREGMSETYWHRGKYQHCPVSFHFDEYDPRKLKAPKKVKASC